MGIILYISMALLAIATYFLNENIRLFMGESVFDNFTPSDLSTCTTVPMLKGCEDLKIHHRSNFAFIGCPGNYKLNGKWLKLGYNPKDQIPFDNSSFIFSYDLKKRTPKKLKCNNLPKDFTFGTHGIDILEDSKDQNKLHIYGVNHHFGGQDTVEHFTHKIGSDSIDYIESFENENFQNLNAVLAVTPKSFYYSKDLTHINGPLNFLESIGVLEGGKIMFRSEDGKVKEVASGFKFSNGLAFNHNRNLLYHTETIRGRIYIFERDPETNELEQKEVIKVKAFPDNINVDPKSGHLYVPVFPSGLNTAKEASKFGTPEFHSINSMVLRVSNQTEEGRFFGENYKIESVISAKSIRMSGTTVAASYEEKDILLLSGILYSEGMLDCRIPL